MNFLVVIFAVFALQMDIQNAVGDQNSDVRFGFDRFFHVSNSGSVLSETETMEPQQGNDFNSNSIGANNQNTFASPAVAGFSVTENEFTAIRIEYIKNQILKKLRLKEKPVVTAGDLPRPLKEYENLLPDQDMSVQSTYTDDFYGKTTQDVIFPFQDSGKCSKNQQGRFPSACIPFQMRTDIRASEVSSAQLWLHKIEDSMDEHNQTFVTSELAHWDTGKNFQKNKPIAIQEVSETDGWFSVDLSYVVKNWLNYQDSPIHALNVACKTCGMDISKSPISLTGDLKPFLVIYTYSQQIRTVTHRRKKRSTTCNPGVNECCKESLYVSFADIGWNDWIIKPEGYNAYFCRGSCLTASALTLSATQHNSILQKIMYGQNSRRRGVRPEITPCCAATQFQPLQLVYRHNNTLTTKLLSNMIVESCGCM